MYVYIYLYININTAEKVSQRQFGGYSSNSWSLLLLHNVEGRENMNLCERIKWPVPKLRK